MTSIQEYYELLSEDSLEKLLQNMERIAKECQKESEEKVFYKALGYGLLWYGSRIKEADNPEMMLKYYLCYEEWRDKLFLSADLVGINTGSALDKWGTENKILKFNDYVIGGEDD